MGKLRSRSVGKSALFLLIALVTARPASAFETGKFYQWFNDGYRGKLQIPETIVDKATEYHYVLVAGFFNEVIPTYFSENMRALRWYGVPRERIHIIWPSSMASYPENREYIRSELARYSADTSHKLVIMGHSRGAVDALAIAMENPEWAREHVAALFLLNGPFGGSPLADYAEGEGPTPGRGMNPISAGVAQLEGDLADICLQPFIQPALKGLTRAASRTFWANMLATHQDSVKELGDRVYFVRSKWKRSLRQPQFYATAEYLSTYFGPNDGVVLTADESLGGIGTVLMEVNGSHNDLIRRGATRARPAGFRYGLMEAILMAVGSPSAPETAPGKVGEPAVGDF